MTGDAGELAALRAKVAVLRCGLGSQLASLRVVAGISQPRLGQALERTRSYISKVEHGTRRMPQHLWTIADEVCAAQGVLLAAYSELVQAEQDYRACCRACRGRTRTQTPAVSPSAPSLPRLPAASVAGGSGLLDAHHSACLAPAGVAPAGPVYGQHVAWAPEAPVDAGLVEELREVVSKVARSVGRREAMRLAGSVFAALGLSGLLDGDEYMRVAEAVAAPSRVDAQVVKNVAVTLAVCKRQEDKLGPCQVVDTVIAQHGLVHRLLAGDCPENLRKPLNLVDSNIAATIGGYLIDMCQPEVASRYFAHARKAAHDAGNTIYAAYAAINTSFTARLLGDAPTALDSAAASRSLAARTGDPQLKALAEQMTAAAYALDGQYSPCMAATARAHDFLAIADGPVPESPAYWVHHGTIDSHASNYLVLLGRPADAVEVASAAQAQFDRAYAPRYAHCQVRLGHALVLSKDITQAARVLSDAAIAAHLYPRLTEELQAARALMQPWNNTHAVRTLDEQLHECGVAITPGAFPGEALRRV